ncbi:DUF6049 family protein [Microbacterium sp.]|uniref:DUF6049 family protein n=1 Tax=Microbacterium sp. TaxID=51671 RepID=UPI0039E44E7F
MTLSSSAARTARALTVAVALLVGLLATTPAMAGAAAAAATTDGAPVTQPLSFAMSPGGGGILTAGTPLTVTIAVANPNDWTVAGGTVHLALSRTALTSDAAVAAWLENPTAGEQELAQLDLAGIAAHGASTTTTTIDTTSLADLTPGVYPLSATSAPTGAVTGSVLVVPDAATTAVAVVVPITAPALTAGLLTADQLATLTAPGGDLREQLDAVTGTPAILAVDPAIPAAIRVLGTTAPASAQQWLADLLALPNSRFALQFGDADLATQVAAGLTTPLTVPTLSPLLSDTGFASATNAPDGDDAALPTLEELTDIGGFPAAGGILWPATGSSDAATVAALGALTTDDAPSVTLVASSTVTPATPTTPRAAAGDAQLLVYDAEVSAALRRASTATDAVTQDAALAAASAYTSLASANASTLLVTIDRGTGRSASAIRAAIDAATALASHPEPGLGPLLAATASTVTVTDAASTDPARAAALTTLLDDESTLTAFATILDDPAVLTARERAEVLQLIGAAWLDDATGFTTAVSDHRAATVTTLDAVGLVPPSGITLLASSAPLTFSIRNDLPWPVSLVLITTPGDPRLIVQNTTPVEAGAAQNTRVQVPVEARVGSGESALRLQLRSPTMVAIGPSTPVHVAVRAEWESVGIIVVVVLLAGMIVLGAVRTVLRRRRRRRDAGQADEEHSDG